MKIKLGEILILPNKSGKYVIFGLVNCNDHEKNGLS